MLKISKILSSAFVSVFLLPSVSHAGDEMIAVVLTPTTASFVGGAGVSTLSRGEVVRVLKRHGATIDAERLDDPPNWDTLTSEEITKAKRPLSLRADAIISVQLFKRSSSWDHHRWPTYTFCEGSCDTGITYHFKSNGAFEASVGGGNASDDLPAQIVRGQLYFYKDLYWARTSARPSMANIFYVQGESFCDSRSCGTP
jgi:hypothetical protein